MLFNGCGRYLRYHCKSLKSTIFFLHCFRRWNKSAPATTEVLHHSLQLAWKLWPTSTTALLVSTLLRTSMTSTPLWTRLKLWLPLMRPAASKLMALIYLHQKSRWSGDWPWKEIQIVWALLKPQCILGSCLLDPDSQIVAKSIEVYCRLELCFYLGFKPCH